jgi:hypothetical protein
MRNILCIKDIILSGIIGIIVGKINRWNIFLTGFIFMLGSHLFNIFIFQNIIYKILKY